jgi:hypothetical protein
MKKILHIAVVSAVIGVAALGYWSSVRADSDASGGPGEDAKITGVIEAIDDTSVTIGGVVYALTDETETEGLLAVGEEVELEFVDNGDDTFTALEIENESEDVEEAADSDETEDGEDQDDADEDEDDEDEANDDDDEDSDDDDDEDGDDDDNDGDDD